MGKVEVGLTLDGGSRHTVVTKEFVNRRKLKNLGGRVPVIGFASPYVGMGAVYEVPLNSTGKRSITVNPVVNAVAVESICYEPPAKCPHNVT
jgi:hypothetical protein